VFPIRTSAIPKAFQLDTTGLENLLIPRDAKFFKVESEILRQQRYYISREDYLHQVLNFNLMLDQKFGQGEGINFTHGENAEDLKSNPPSKKWKCYFKLDHKAFKKKGYEFSHFMTTDGYSCSIIFEKKHTKASFQENDRYINSMSINERYMFSRRTIVGIDPGVNNIFTAVTPCLSEELFIKDPSESHSELIRFFYSKRDRKRKKKSSFFSSKRKSFISAQPAQGYDGTGFVNIDNLERKLREYNHKTVDLEKYISYVHVKVVANEELYLRKLLESEDC
jgi:hypothetical protein